MATAGIVALTLVAVGACSSGGGHGAAPSTTGAATSSTVAPASTTTAATASTASTAGCPATGDAAVPAGMASRVMGDLDGDGRPDTLYVGVGPGGVRRFGVVTASGSRSEWTVPNASPVDPSIYGVADANQDGHLEVFVSPGRVAYVLTLSACKLQPYVNKDGDPYAFSTGFGAIGTGVGCVDANHDGRRDLVGLDETTSVNGTVHWTRTIVTLHGTQARNGATDSGTYHSPADDRAISLLDQVTCGDNAFMNPLVAKPS